MLVWHEMLKIALASGAPPPDPGGGAYDAPHNPLVGSGFLPLGIAASQDLTPLEIKSGYAPAYN